MPAEQLNYHIGIVKWYDSSKGYGFIQTVLGFDVFVHETSVFAKLKENDYVMF